MNETVLESIEKFNSRLNTIGMRATEERAKNGKTLTAEQDSILDIISGMSDYFSIMIYPHIKEELQ